MDEKFYEDIYKINLETTQYGKVFQKLITKDGFSNNIIENYDNEVLVNMKKVIEDTIIPTQYGNLMFKNVIFEKAKIPGSSKMTDLTPKMAREKLTPYFSDIYVDIVHSPIQKPIAFIGDKPIYGPKVEVDDIFYKQKLGSIPIMLGSKICHLHGKTPEERYQMGECFNDPLGYFFIRSERVINNQENLRLSTFLIYQATKDPKCSVKGVITCPTKQGTRITNLVICKHSTLNLTLHHIKLGQEPLNIFIVYRILGMKMNDAIKQILSFCDKEDHFKIRNKLAPTIAAYKIIAEEDEDLENLKNRILEIRKSNSKSNLLLQVDRVTKDIEDDLLSNIEGNERKMLHLSMYASRMAEYMIDKRTLDDRDNFSNKRIATPGRSLYFLFKCIWADFVKEITNKVSDSNIKSATQISHLIKPANIREQLIKAFGPNAWGVKRSYRKDNITESLKRDTPLAVFSQIGRIITPSSRQSKNSAVRMPHPSQIGFACCLVGDTDVILDDNINTQKISLMDDTYKVMTINPNTLIEEKSDIENFFMLEPTKVLEISTISGRKIKCTPDHPFLIARIGKTEWVQAGDLNKGDYVIVKNYTLPLSKNGEKLIINNDEILDKHKNELDNLGFLNCEIDEDRMSLLARISGALMTDGTLSDRAPYGYPGWNAVFCLGEEADVKELQNDIQKLGFEAPNYSFRQNKFDNKIRELTSVSSYYQVTKGGAFGNLMKAIGVSVGNKSTQAMKVPEWIMKASLNVKREFLSGLQGGDGSRISVNPNNKQYKISMGTFQNTCVTEYDNEYSKYFEQLVSLYKEFNIDCKFYKNISQYNTIQYSLYINNELENIYKYSNIISYRYCNEKRRYSALPIEYIRYRYVKFNEKKQIYDKVLTLFESGMKQIEIVKATGVKQKLVSRICTRGRDYEISIIDKDVERYDTFCSKVFTYDERVYVPIDNINETKIEPVYDFTTKSDNHSFYANGFLVHNCFETPEGEGLGLVKNLAVSCYISLERDPQIIIEILRDPNLKDYIYINKDDDDMIPITVNGIIEGWTSEEDNVVKFLKYYKSQGLIDKDVCIFNNIRDKCVEIYCDSGRPCRPLFVVDEKTCEINIDKLNMWNADIDELVKSNCIEYIDAREQEWLYMAETIDKVEDRRKVLLELQNHKEGSERYNELIILLNETIPYSHCEIDPTAMLSIAGNLIPQANRQAGPRTSYQCVEENTLVLTENFTKVPIKNLKNGDYVISVNPENGKMEKTQIYNHFNIDSSVKGGDVYKIETLSGRSIITTEDHMFLTNEGWIEAKDLNIENHTLSIHPVSNHYESKCEKVVVLSEKDFIEKLENLNVKSSLIIKHTEKLKELNLLPLFNDDNRIDSISRIYGHLISDGSANVYREEPYIQAGMERIEDIEIFENDINNLGFIKNKITRKNENNSVSITRSGAVASFFIGLGITLGDKNYNKSNPLPLFIKKGSKNTKKEFLASFQGGDGCRIRWNKYTSKDKIHYNYVMASTSQCKNNENISSLFSLFSEISELFSEFDIKTNVKVIQDVGINKLSKCELLFPNEIKEFIKYMDNIGFRYCINKHLASSQTVEFLRYKNIHNNEIYELKKYVLHLYNNGKRKCEIKKLLNLKDTIVDNFIRHPDSIPVSDFNFMKIDEWCNKCIIKDTILFTPIKSITKVDHCRVADFTTVSENHSFISNDFITHNCSMGRQALTQYHSNEHLRFDASYKMVHYPTKTLFQNDLQETAGLNSMSNGQTVQVAILAHPDNAEDGIVFKEEAIKYGNKLDNAKKFTFAELIKSSNDYTERFAKPPLIPGEPAEKYSAIDEKGIPILDAYIREGDCVIGKIKEFNKSVNGFNVGDIKNTSQFAGKGESGYIDRVLIILTNDHQQQMIKVKVRQNRKYIPGDKLACLTPDHEVQTERGWININELNITDKIATLNKENEIEYHSPSIIHHYSSENETLYEIQNENISMCITKNHRLFYSEDNIEWKLREVCEVKNLPYFFIKGLENSIKVESKDFKEVTDVKSVHCITIQNEIFLVKRNDKVHWTGNSRYSQKGTISRIVPAREMPRVSSGPLKGMVPDILINPHSQPSRMTMNMIIEILSSKAACINGKFYNATTFRDYENDMEEIQQTLTDYGLDPNGYDYFEFPDGTPMKTKVYFGPCYYQALRHHVNDKIQMRARAGLKPSTRQPVSGRSNEGGLKVGEMERDALISHGSSALLRERLMGVSDQYDLPICSNCGTIAITRTDDSIKPNECRLCKDKAKFGIITIPYVLKLLLYYLNAACINFRFKTTEIKYPNNRPIEEQFLSS